MTKILFITHDTSRSGAPFVLLYFLKWLKKNYSEVNFSVVTLKGGSLADEFKTITDNFYEIEKYEKKAIGLKEKIKEKIYSKFCHQDINRKKNTLLRKLANGEFDFIYANTVVSIPLACEIKEMNKKNKIVAHIHELNTVIKILLPDLSRYIPKIDGFIAVSNLVKQDLIRTFDIPTGKIKLVYEYIEPLTISQKNNKIFTVGGCGNVDWRKGYDIFIQVARYIEIYQPRAKIEFVWVGNFTSKEKIVIDADLEKADLQGNVFFVGEQKDREKYFSKFDIFLLPSREDPFPLVALEMGMLGKPIVCFENATGIVEVIKGGGGAIVPYLDVKGMAEQVLYYFDNKNKTEEDGKLAHKVFSHYITENIAPQLFEYLKKLN